MTPEPEPLEPRPPGSADAPGGPGARAWVLVRYIGQPLGEMVPLPLEGLEIGRAPECGICLPEPEVSRRHARLEVAEDGASLALLDLGSTNGVYVNGRKAEATPSPAILRPGDVLRVGGHAFKVKWLDLLERRYHQAPETPSALDAWTGVSSRAAVLHQLEAHFEWARRHHRPLSVILADLDHLGRLNETHGSPAGDRVIRAFGGHLLRRLRDRDSVGRLGGAEFLAVLPGTPSELALPAADDLRLALAEQGVELEDGRLIQATCSLGVADLKAGDPCSGAVLARADAALHRAKTGGRNRVAQAP
ncbi:hypothetical protein GETHOR_24110 [Geothrix oryzae]|uniref:diguanylate cyclase n=1 Tax=Geothrix oryzae TaxID=2927975 RepID=A0ABM8DTK1_9BACT|nr:GGDEF domain-containing protein [Geothrix oryzae]BDU70310.1 hypothetical protein GETHOR_24110 [Geothrix oryzae]